MNLHLIVGKNVMKNKCYTNMAFMDNNFSYLCIAVSLFIFEKYRIHQYVTSTYKNDIHYLSAACSIK